MYLALTARPILAADALDHLVAHDPWFATASPHGARPVPHGPTAQPTPGRALTIEWLVARDIDTYRARRGAGGRGRPTTGR